MPLSARAAGDGRLTPLRIFLATPSDVAAERRRVHAVVEELNAHNGLAEQNGFTLRLLGWEDASAGMGRAQGVLLEQMPPQQWDIFIGALWTRFGTPSGGRDAATGRPYDSGTEEEFRAAHNAWLKTKRPHIFFYRRTTAPRSLEDIKLDQYQKVKAFFAEFGHDGEHPGLFTAYKNLTEFERRVRQDLTRKLLELAASARAADLPATAPKPASSAAATSTAGGRAREDLVQLLYELISESFSLYELQDLAFQMHIEYDDLPGETKSGKVRSLVEYCRNRGRLDELANRLKRERPHLAGRLNS